MAALRPPLSYSLPAFNPAGFDGIRRWLDNLKELHFPWVTLHPTWLVYDETPPRIRPDAPDVRSGIEYARELGLKVQIEPHLDWETTLTGGAYDWRRRMRLDPTGPYFDLVLQPMAALQPDRLTLGSELDVSVYEFTNKWIEVAARLLPSYGSSRRLPDGRGSVEVADSREPRASASTEPLASASTEPRASASTEPHASASTEPRALASGHKLNHDVFERGNGQDLREYLRHLEYVAFSFYPKIDFEDAAGDLVRDLREIAGPLPEFAIGEFGLGCSDITKPWHFEASTFQTPEHFEIRRDYYLRFLQWIAAQPYTASPITFWTAGHYDFLGVLEQPGLEAFRDEVLRGAVSEYNRSA